MLRRDRAISVFGQPAKIEIGEDGSTMDRLFDLTQQLLGAGRQDVCVKKEK
jgi:hypothetical protein